MSAWARPKGSFKTTRVATFPTAGLIFVPAAATSTHSSRPAGRTSDQGRSRRWKAPPPRARGSGSSPDVGKTHLAIALGVRIYELGQRAYFTTAIDLARRLARATAENRLHRGLRNLVPPSVLIIDEVGYLTLDTTQASLLFQVICERYEKQQAIVLTSNKASADWAQVFAGDAVMASAALDRLLHRATVINIRGESYRMKDRRRADSRETSAGQEPQPIEAQPTDPGPALREPGRRTTHAKKEVMA